MLGKRRSSASRSLEQKETHRLESEAHSKVASDRPAGS
jgi:hypothetical protein